MFIRWVAVLNSVVCLSYVVFSYIAVYIESTFVYVQSYYNNNR